MADFSVCSVIVLDGCKCSQLFCHHSWGQLIGCITNVRTFTGFGDQIGL